MSITLLDAFNQGGVLSLQKPVDNTATPAERRIALLAEAHAAYEQMCVSGEAYDAAEVHHYIHALACGESAERPQPKVWRELTTGDRDG